MCDIIMSTDKICYNVQTGNEKSLQKPIIIP